MIIDERGRAVANGPRQGFRFTRDKLYNARAILLDLRAIGGRLWERFNLGTDDRLRYYRSLVTAFRAAPKGDAPVSLVNDLDQVVTDLERVAARD